MRFRRTFIATMLTLALLALIVSPVAAAGPERSKIPAWTVDFPSGTLCEFAVRWDFPADGTELVFPVRPNGDQLVRSVGRLRGTITNLDADRSVTVRGGYRLDLLFHANGTIDVVGSGTIVAGYFPTDAGGPSMWFFRGRFHDEVDATFTATAHSFRGSATDLCAALS